MLNNCKTILVSRQHVCDSSQNLLTACYVFATLLDAIQLKVPANSGNNIIIISYLYRTICGVTEALGNGSILLYMYFRSLLPDFYIACTSTCYMTTTHSVKSDWS